nr:reverse transcriptase domain-containing protein [Tanacetum cinerariifolium]
MSRLLYDNSSPRPPEEFVSKNSNAEIKSFSPSPIHIKDSDSLMKEINLSFSSDDLMLSGIKDDDYDSERDFLILEDLLDNYSLSLPEIESYHFDIPSFFRPPAKPADGNTGILNIRMMGDISKQKTCAKCPMTIHGKNTPILDVPLFHFYPLDQLMYEGNRVKLSNLKQALRGRCSNRRRVPNVVELEIRTIEEIVPIADRTIEELLQAPTKGYGDSIVIPEILTENFEIKTNLL